MSTYIKDPNSTLDYVTDWTGWLADGETIDSHTVEVDDGLDLDSDSTSDGTVTAWLSGGEVGAVYTVTFRIVTNQGRTDDRSVRIRVQER